ncbi:MAG: CBS domain-containing protein, partial [Burkholderiales bacterium]|nr:CBS domain-containing protein [Burkholderiales bacterium]
SQRIREVMHREQLIVAGPDTTVSEAARTMADSGTSAVVVLEGQALAGIFTERDAVLRVIAAGLDPRQTRLGAVMTPQPVTLDPGKTFGRALALMHERRIRHVPIVENERVVGIVTARDALDPDLEEFVCEAQRRQALT